MSIIQSGIQSAIVSLQRLMSVLFRLKEWLLLDLNRHVLAFILVAISFTLFTGLELSGTIDAGRDTVPMLYLFSALAGGNITLITIVISINQLILSRELRSPRELQTEMHAAEEFRNEVEAETESFVVPEQPAEFLRILIEDTRRQVAKLNDGDCERVSASFQGDLDDLGSTLGSDLEETVHRLDQTRGGVFPALSTILGANFATHINHTRWLKRAHAESMSDSTQTLLDGLEQHLEQLDIARQYFKTIYIKQELADVSKLIMSTGLVAVLVAIIFIVIVGYLRRPLPAGEQLFLIPLAVSLNLIPLAVLVSHVFRIATVARRTAAITPFLAPTD